MLLDDIVNNNDNKIDYSETKTDFVLSKADTIIYDSEGVRIGFKKHQGKYILGVDRSSDVGFTVVLDEGQLHSLRKKLKIEQ